ncbi:MAG: ribbon-helix-helix protein, CopG family [Bacillota bacterium]|nr:ribbon-helix-helix protein, CopG family [Bacillota bacterium]
MQLNIYIPESKKDLLEVLSRTAARTGKSKSEIVIVALERYLPAVSQPPLGRFNLGAFRAPRRAELYEERLGKP